jgi:hypothetical protein
MSRNTPLISNESAVFLAQIINRAAASFDIAALSAEEAIEAYTLLDRLTDALWREHRHVLLPLYRSILARQGMPDDDEPDEPEGTGGATH